MTKVNRKVSRETYATIRDMGRDRSIIVSIEPPNLIGVRLKGTRRRYWLPVDVVYMQALRAHVAWEKKEKAKARKKR